MGCVLVYIKGKKIEPILYAGTLQYMIYIIHGDHRVDNAQLPGGYEVLERVAGPSDAIVVAVYPESRPSLLKQKSRVVLLPVAYSDFHKEFIFCADSIENLSNHAVFAILAVNRCVEPRQGFYIAVAPGFSP